MWLASGISSKMIGYDNRGFEEAGVKEKTPAFL